MIEKAILIVGLARTGKDTAANYLVQKHGYVSITFSDLLGEELVRRGKPNTKMNQAELGDELRAKDGMDAVAKLGMEKAETHSKVVFVGARSVEEIELVKQNSKLTRVIKLESSLENRSSRKGDRTDADQQTLKKRDFIDIENKGLGKVLEIADITICNNNSKEELFQEMHHAIVHC